jgi:hypothetical protein
VTSRNDKKFSLNTESGTDKEILSFFFPSQKLKTISKKTEIQTRTIYTFIGDLLGSAYGFDSLMVELSTEYQVVAGSIPTWKIFQFFLNFSFKICS